MPIAVIQHQGQMTSDGEGVGHYICDVKSKDKDMWFQTNDNQIPVSISANEVTQSPVVVLYKKK